MTTSDPLGERVYYVVEMTVPYSSLSEVQAQAPAELAGHLARAGELHEAGDVLMAGAFLQPDPQDGHLRTMAICRSREAAERFVAGDPFVQNGTVLDHRIRPWANMFAR
ncbi:YciI family protein [Actinoplanes sp. KI2]|uniref:YciI family protein n=1 Tax=Actinoplanes sp. KI2 TaxID=2983315 RepID=UPI0021D5EE49|nr:YciI family protein [Actinoplanes sp. KI2]MCU7723919.1 YciI family protein [Actinoplanes sp. KI2]